MRAAFVFCLLLCGSCCCCGLSLQDLSAEATRDDSATSASTTTKKATTDFITSSWRLPSLARVLNSTTKAWWMAAAPNASRTEVILRRHKRNASEGSLITPESSIWLQLLLDVAQSVSYTVFVTSLNFVLGGHGVPTVAKGAVISSFWGLRDFVESLYEWAIDLNH